MGDGGLQYPQPVPHGAHRPGASQHRHQDPPVLVGDRRADLLLVRIRVRDSAQRNQLGVKGQIEAARALGMPFGLIIRGIVLPQALARTIQPLVNIFIACLIELTYGTNNIFKKDFKTITFDMYPIYMNIGFGYHF